VGYYVREVRLVDAHGRQVGGFDADVFRLLTNGRYLRLARGDLAKLLCRKIEGRCEMIFNDMVAGIEQDEGSVLVAFQHRRPRRWASDVQNISKQRVGVAHGSRRDEGRSKRDITLDHPECLALSDDQCLPLRAALLKASTKCSLLSAIIFGDSFSLVKKRPKLPV
jgi:hypothetical protein